MAHMCLSVRHGLNPKKSVQPLRVFTGESDQNSIKCEHASTACLYSYAVYCGSFSLVLVPEGSDLRSQVRMGSSPILTLLFLTFLPRLLASLFFFLSVVNSFVRSCVRACVFFSFRIFLSFLFMFVSVLPNNENKTYTTTKTINETKQNKYIITKQGPSVEKLSPLVHSAMPILIGLMRDPHVMVKDSATWTIGKICELHGPSIPAEALTPLVEALLLALKDSPRVCSKACFALHNFGDQFEDTRDEESNALSPYLSALVHELLLATQREDGEWVGVRGGVV